MHCCVHDDDDDDCTGIQGTLGTLVNLRPVFNTTLYKERLFIYLFIPSYLQLDILNAQRSSFFNE